MAKIIGTYGGITATTIKNNAEIPASTDMTVSGSNVLCSNIKDSLIKSTLGESSNAISVLCKSSLVNFYANFSPKQFVLTGSSITVLQRTPYNMGYFAGYNHGAVAPYINSQQANFNVYEGQTSAYITSSILLGEYDWMTIPFLASVNMEVSIAGIGVVGGFAG